MSKILDRLDQARGRALEVGVHLPLGACSKMQAQVTGLDAGRLKRFYAELVTRGEQRLKPVEKVVRKSGLERPGSAPRRARKQVKRSRSGAASDIPHLRRVAAPQSASQLPVSGYKSLTVQDILVRLHGLTQSDLARVYKYERAHEDRSTVTEWIESRFIELPIATYDSLTVEEIAARAERLSSPDLKLIRKYEADTKARSTILEKLDSLIAES
ncbi:MAG: hypothetical protein M3280_02885 [Actinomycetota bacterium]|nr:hypothetical protein [Actinomycetota bacterium]